MKKYLVSVKDGKLLTMEADYMKIDKGVLIFHSCTGVVGLISLDEIKYVIDEKGSKISYSEKNLPPTNVFPPDKIEIKETFWKCH